MTCLTRVRYLPGDLIEDSYYGPTLITSVENIGIKGHHIRAVSYGIMTQDYYSFVDTRHSVQSINNLPPYRKILNRIFNPGRNYICSSDQCVVKEIIEECMYCNYKIDYTKADKVFFPEDKVWSPMEKKIYTIHSSHLCVPVLNDKDTGYATIAEDTKWDDISLCGFFKDHFGGEIDIVAFYEFLLERFKTKPPTLSYKSWETGKYLPRMINLYKQSDMFGFIPEKFNICPMCLFQDSEKCNKCITKHYK
jgi:hypothetical protein